MCDRIKLQKSTLEKQGDIFSNFGLKIFLLTLFKKYSGEYIDKGEELPVDRFDMFENT